MRHLISAFLLIGSLGIGASAFAQPKSEPSAQPRAESDQAEATPNQTTDNSIKRNRLTLIGFNAFGPSLGSGLLQYEHRSTYGHSDNPLFDGLYGAFTAGLTASPALVGLTLRGEWLPLAVLRIRASYSALYYTGDDFGLGHGLHFPSVDAPFDEATLKARKGEGVAHLAHRAQFMLTLRAKLGPLIVFTDTEVAAWYLPEIDGPGYGYETYYDSLIERGTIDGVLMNQTALLYEIWKGEGATNLRAGVVHEYTYTLGAGFSRSRLGAMFMWTPFDRVWGMDAPMLLLMPGITLADKHRENEFWAKVALVINWDL